MKTVKLLPNTKRLKQIIKEHGSQWRVLDDRPVLCFGGQRGILIQSMDESHMRWVKPVDIKRESMNKRKE